MPRKHVKMETEEKRREGRACHPLRSLKNLTLFRHIETQCHQNVGIKGSGVTPGWEWPRRLCKNY